MAISLLLTLSLVCCLFGSSTSKFLKDSSDHNSRDAFKPPKIEIQSSGLSSFGHSFPSVDENGHQIANEFQVLNPHNILINSRLSASLQSTEIFMITNVAPLIIPNDGIVNVSFYSTNPSKKHWIGAYSPIVSETNLTKTVPVKYAWCDMSINYTHSGHGMVQFNLTNLRDSVGFYFFSNGLKSPIYLNRSTEYVTFSNINEPLRPRIVATGDPNVLKLLWSSAKSTGPVLQWGIRSGVYPHVVNANTSSIPQSSMCGWPANSTGWRDMGLIHSAFISGVASLTTAYIYYIFGDAPTNDFSSEYVFRLPPLAGEQPINRSTTVVLYDDLGRGSTDHTYTWNEYGRPSIRTTMSVGDRVLRGEIDAVYHGGDISYATGYEAVWDFFLDQLSPVAARTLYLTTVGNHESDWMNTASYYGGDDSGGECGVSATTLLPMPSPASRNEPWWSYDVGLIHFIGISTEHNYTHGSPQYFWLENDLMNVNRTKTPWIIFGGHRAMYLNSDYGGTPTSDITVMNLMIKSMEELLWKYRVNIGFYGHNHCVQRQSAVYNKTVVQRSTPVYNADGSVTYHHHNPQATVHMVVGTGGASFTVNAMDPPPEWNERYFYRWGYTIVTAVNATYLDWKWIDSYTEEVLDHMVLTQVDPNAPWVLPSAESSNPHVLSARDIALIVVFSTLGMAAIVAAVVYFIQKKPGTDYCRLNNDQGAKHSSTTNAADAASQNPMMQSDDSTHASQHVEMMSRQL